METFCFVCKKKLGVLNDRAKKKWIQGEGRIPPEGMDDEDVLCIDCLELIREGKRARNGVTEKEKPTILLYLVPIFMGLLGGILMYIAVKDQNQEMANAGMVVGVFITIIGITFYAIILVAGLASIEDIFPT